MARRLILDAGVLIAWERNLGPAGFVQDDDDVALAAVSVAELRAGVLLGDVRRVARRQAFLDRALVEIVVEPYDEATAREHAALLAHTRRLGRPRAAHDLIIAATAVQTLRTLVTTDRRARFEDLPGVRSVTVESP